MNNVVHYYMVRSVIKRWRTHSHFMNQDAEAPPIDHLIITFLQYDFWGKVLSCAAQGICEVLALVPKSLREPEICQF